MSWALGSSCPQSEKNRLKPGGRRALYPIGSSAIPRNWQGLLWCAHARVHMCMNREVTNLLSLSLPASLMLFQIFNPTELRGRSDWGVCRTHMRAKTGESSLPRKLPCCLAGPKHTAWALQKCSFNYYCTGRLQWAFLSNLDDKHHPIKNTAHT